MSDGYKVQKAIEQIIQDHKRTLTLDETIVALSRVSIETLCRCTKTSDSRKKAYGALLRQLSYDIVNMELLYGGA